MQPNIWKYCKHMYRAGFSVCVGVFTLSPLRQLSLSQFGSDAASHYLLRIGSDCEDRDSRSRQTFPRWCLNRANSNLAAVD